MESLINARLELNDYTNRVLGIIKLKYGFKDKSQAMNKFAEIFGDEFLEKQATDEYVSQVISLTKKHLKNNSNKKMSLKQLDELCEV